MDVMGRWVLPAERLAMANQGGGEAPAHRERHRGASRRLSVLALVLSMVPAPGCVMMLQEMSYGSNPGFEQVQSEWDAIAPSDGRIVFYCLRDTFNQWTWGLLLPIVTVAKVDLTERHYDLIDGCFIYTDLPAGAYTITEQESGEVLELTVQPGTVRFVILAVGESPREIDELVALNALAELTHNYEDTLPYFEQPIVVQYQTR